jgi:streptogramin lyase
VIIGFALAPTSSAQFVLFPVADPSQQQLRGICLGPDGNIWFTVANRVGRLTPAGAITTFELPTANARPGDIVTGPDGNLWFLEETAPAVGRISPAGSITEYPVPAADAGPRTIVVGPDGAIWFSDFLRDSIWRMTLSGNFTEYPASGASTSGLSVGSDGNLWFTTIFGFPKWIGRMTPSGGVTLFPRPPSTSFGLGCALGPDGNIWYGTARAFGRVTPAGAITEFPLAGDRGHVTTDVAVGPDGNLWMPVDETWLCIPSPCTPPPGRDAILRVSVAGVQTRYELAAELQIGDGAKIAAGPAGSVWFTALGGLVRFFPAELPGGTPSADVPTMGDFARVALVGLLALAGFALLRR